MPPKSKPWDDMPQFFKHRMLDADKEQVKNYMCKLMHIMGWEPKEAP